MEPNIRLSYWKGTVAFLILHSQRNTLMTTYGSALSDTLSTTSQEYIIVFLISLKEIFTFSKSLALGQHTLIGNLKTNVYYYCILFIVRFKLFLQVLGLKITLIQYDH